MFYSRDKLFSEAQYEAIAVIEHEGSMTSDGDGQGHYICDVRCRETETWFRTNDNQNPIPISPHSVTKNAIVILYKRK